MVTILMYEESAADVEIITRQLRTSHIDCDTIHTATEAAFRLELLRHAPDIILADTMRAFEIARDLAPDTPFIFLSGATSKELARLPLAIERAMAERRAQNARKAIQEALETSERRFHLAARATRDVIWDLDLSNNHVWVNDALFNEWGHETTETVTLEWLHDRIHPDDRDRIRQELASAIAGNAARVVMRYRFRRASGEYGRVIDQGMMVRGPNGNAQRIIGAMQDVTEHATALDLLAETQHLASLGSWSYDTEQDRVVWSEETRRIFGNDADTPITYQSYLSFIHPDDLDSVLEILDAWFSLDRPPAQSEFEHRIIRPDGSIRIVHCRVTSNERGLLGTVQDVTDWKRMQEQVEQSTRVATLGRLVATTAHEFNNVLMAIKPFADLIARHSSDPRIDSWIAQILNAVERGRRTTLDILNTTQTLRPLLQSVDLAEWLQDLRPEIEVVAGPKVAVTIEPPAESIFVRCDPMQLQQVVTNLVANARDAMPNGGELTITIVTEGDDRVCLDVIDTGNGIPSDLLPNIFDPLFTTKRHGTGLGLSVVKQIVTRGGGTVNVDSIVGVGTVFHIELRRDPTQAVSQTG